MAIISCLTQDAKWDPLPYLNTDVHAAGLQSFNTVRGMKMPSNLKNYEPLLVRKDIAELAELGAALMPGSMTLAPLNASVGFGQLMIYLRSRTVL